MRCTCLIGGSGFIGTALSRELIKAKRSVVVIDHQPPQVDGLQHRKGDFGDEAFISHALRDVDEVVLLAYASVPKTSFDDPFADIQHNLPPTLRLFQAILAAKVKKLIVVSSGGTVYGSADFVPITEEHPTRPISPYGITKLTVEKYAQMFHALYGMPYTIVRPGNAYGPGQRPYSGQGLIATAIASIMQQKEFTLFGDEITRDYIYVDDLARALVAVLERGQMPHIYNVGTGVGTSNGAIIELIEAEARRRGLEARIKRGSARPFDVMRNALDASKLTKDTGWRPKVAFEKGLGETWNWLREYAT